jgi:putative PIN family toxin of toxin-antitoxin system
VLKATADTNIYISALQFGGQPQRFLELARSGSIELAISPPIIAEIQRVLRDKFKWPADAVEQIEPRLAAFTRRVTPTETLDVVKNDPPDNRILECAKAARSEYVVTGDDDLLRLGQYADIQIVKVSDFLTRVQFQSDRI